MAYTINVQDDRLSFTTGKQTFFVEVPPYDEDDAKVMSLSQYMAWWEDQLRTALDNMLAEATGQLTDQLDLEMFRGRGFR